MTRTPTRLGRAALLALVVAPAAAAGPIAVDPQKARDVLKQHCHRCPSGAGSEGGEFDVLDVATLTAARGGDPAYVRPNDPDGSYLLDRVKRGNMPPKSVRDRPTAKETEALWAWIAAGAPAFTPGPEAAARKPVSLEATLTAVRDHLQSRPAEARPHVRYFTLAHLHNNPKVPAGDLRTVRAALSKAVNSLHWRPDIVLPAEVPNTSGTVYAVDLRDLDWDRTDVWRDVAKAYPYGLRYDQSASDGLRAVDAEIGQLAGLGAADPLPVVRADWFVATATRPPLYHALLAIPQTAGELEARLNVDVADNLRRDRAARAGFAASGVSGQNRLLERHAGAFGAYWKSYDFLPNKPRANLLTAPLGPQFAGHPHPDAAFDHDGGEIVFALPNRLYGYMLVDGKDNRIDSGPIAVVSDSLKTAGTPDIVTGLSCIACHKHGMIGFKDQVRDGNAVFGAARQKVERLYPPAAELAAKVREDEAAFMAALEKTVGPFLRAGDDATADLRTLTADEPVAAVARAYRWVDLDLASAAYELGFDSPAELKAMVAGSRRLREIGLAPLTLDGGRVKRHDWEKARVRSVYQMAAQELGRGTPVTSLR